ncbi:hypothetical protein F5Y14DRAFT_27571 [Nemania sp. NC0429]|nr:hypothetical protein F5Y14DRAFT_27571 [Nemania sp. NC0429]
MAQVQTILPKGIVLNRNAVYEEIAKYDIIPVEQILRACHVFSTTSRELYDPTARRLENFWTRVLGGDRRYLSGRVIAQLFKDISEEASFVKLRGPDNRYEPPSPITSASKSDGVQATSVVSASKPKSKPTSSAKTPHPILKKPRGPSASGPRPTARFVSPPEIGIDEGGVKRSGATTPTTTVQSSNSGDLGNLTTKEEKRKGQSYKSKKKAAAFVASSSRRRPGMPRRSSSQSSAVASDVGPKEADSLLGSKYDDSHSSVSTILERSEQQSAGTKKGTETTLSSKAAGKRPMTKPLVEETLSKTEPVQNSPIKQGSAEAKKQNLAQLGRERAENGTKMLSSSVQGDTQHHLHSKSSPFMARSSSDVGSTRPPSREVSRSFVPSSSLMSSTLAKLDTSVIGQATIYGFTENVHSQGSLAGSFEAGGNKETYDAVSQTSDFSGVSRQMTPTQPSNAATIPLGHSKSQLSLLLKRQAEKKPNR